MVKCGMAALSKPNASQLTTNQSDRKLQISSVVTRGRQVQWNKSVCTESDISMHGMALGCIRSHSCSSVSVNKHFSYPSKYTSQQQNYTIIPPDRESWCYCVCSFLLQIFKGNDQPPKGCIKVSSLCLDIQKLFTFQVQAAE